MAANTSAHLLKWELLLFLHFAWFELTTHTNHFLSLFMKTLNFSRKSFMLIWGGSGKHFSPCECLVKALLMMIWNLLRIKRTAFFLLKQYKLMCHCFHILIHHFALFINCITVVLAGWKFCYHSGEGSSMSLLCWPTVWCLGQSWYHSSFDLGPTI